MKEMNQVKMNRLMALDADWRKDSKFKELCRKTWSPQLFAQCENKIAELKAIAAIEDKLLSGESVKQLDISEIDVGGM